MGDVWQMNIIAQNNKTEDWLSHIKAFGFV